MDLTPEKIFQELRQTVVGQDEFLKTLSSAAWTHHLRYQFLMDTGEYIGKPKQNLLVIGGSGTGKTLAVQTLGKLLNLPVIIEDASSITGEGWRGKSISSIIPQIYRATDRAEERVFSIVVLDEIDKVFRSNSSNEAGISESGFLPLNNLLTFLAGGMITCTDKDCNCSMDVSSLLVICLGAFEGLDEIVRKRLSGNRQIGFCSGRREELVGDDILQYVTEADLHEFGIPWELLGRISLITKTRPLDAGDYKRILTQSDVSPIRQFDDLLSQTSGISVSITDAAVGYIAARAKESSEGARMLARMVTETLQPAIFSISDSPCLSGIEIDYGGSGLYIRREYCAYPDMGKQERDPLASINPDILSTVPFNCSGNRGDILLYAETIKKASRRAWLLPPEDVSAAVCILTAAICSQLEYAGGADRNMLTLCNQIDMLPSERILHPESHLARMMDEFIRKAQEYGNYDKAKRNAKQIITDYCRNYSISQEQYSA